MILLLFCLLLLAVILTWFGQYKATIYCFSATLLLAIAVFLSHATKDLPLQL